MVSKTSTKKTTKKANSSKSQSKKTTSKKAKIVYEQPSKKKDYFFPIILIVAALIIVGFVSNGTFFLNSFNTPAEETVEGDQTVLVTVNGEEILQGELDEYWNRLPPQIKLQLTKEDLLEEFIQERLLLQEADEKGIEVSESEVEEYITAQLSASGLTLEQFEGILAQQDTSLERMKEIYTRQLKLAKLFEERSDEDLISSDEEINTYYEEHKEEFFSAEQATVRHILISVNENVDDATAQERVADIEAQLKEAENENFCDLVSEFSGDPGSVDNCGEYTFAKGVMVAEFEEAAFDMENDELRTVKTGFGYHIMLKDALIEASYLDLEDSVGDISVKEAIERILAESKARAIYDTYITELKENAEIFYMSEEETPQEEVSQDEASDDEEEQAPQEEIIIDSEDVIVEVN